MEKRKSIILIICSLLITFTYTFSEAKDGALPIPVKVDHRGLLEIPGVLRMNSKTNWGASNLVIQPRGSWSAQDYCLENIKKADSIITADFKTSPALKMVESINLINDTKFDKSWRVNYILTPKSEETVSYEKLYIYFPFASKDFANGKIVLDDGSNIILPEKPSGEIKIPQNTKSVTITNGKSSFTVKSANLRFALKDLRPKNTAFQLWLEYPNPTNRKSIWLDFEISAEALPYVVKADNKEWIKLDYKSHEIDDGSILDFSSLNDAPAGKYGRIINKDGHFVYEGTGERIKLIGTNLCYTANYLEKEEADKIAAHFQKMGYNAVRFHHTDVHIRKGSWNSRISDDIDPAWLDKLDYMFAAMKKAGMYITIDLFTQRRFGKGEIAGINKDIVGDIKKLVPIHEPAFDAWKKLVVKWMNHINPYTGIAWKDDPALVFVCPVNEDSIFSSWSGIAKQFYLKRFSEWKKAKNLTSKIDNPANDPLFAQFLIEVKMKSNKKIEVFLKELGLKAMITGSNWWDTMAQTFTRNQFDLVDNHQYSDHPQPWTLPSKYNQKSNLKGNYSYMVPIMMAPTRIFGKPFTVTEYNYCSPNKYRAEGGALMGGYAALQDWDALYRFAWAHDKKRVNDNLSMFGFDMSSDPLNQLTERQIILMFRRGDVSPAIRKYVYGVTMKEATKDGVGDMWFKGLFPHNFNAMGLISQTGSQIVEGEAMINGKFDGVISNGDHLDATSLSGNKYIANKDLPKISGTIVSDTNEIIFDSVKGSLKIQSPKTECIVAPKGIDLTANNLSISENDSFNSVSTSAMDEHSLQNSKRILLLHLTNVLGSEMKFVSESMTTLTGRGKLPYIVNRGSVKVSLKNSNSDMKLYACDFSGKRIKEISTQLINGAYEFKLNISQQTPYMIYELIAEDSIQTKQN